MKNAVVTGGGSGIGAAIVARLRADGLNVASLDLQPSDDEFSHVADVTDRVAVDAAMNAVRAQLGPVSVLVNAAGLDCFKRFTDISFEKWQRVIDVNLNGVFYGHRYAIPAIEASGGGAIVNISSILGSVGYAHAVAYTAAKHGVVGLTKVAAMEYSARGIRVNAIGPAFIDTPLLDNLPAGARESLVAAHPIGRLGTPEEVAALTLFLLSDRAGFITGSYHLVDGAYTAQ